MRSRLAAGLAGALLLLAGCGGTSQGSGNGTVSGVSVHDPDNLHGIVLPKPYRLPDVPLEDSHGKPFDVAKDSTKPLTLVFFGYTHCPDICQLVMANLASTMTRLDDAQRSKVGMVFVTTDPARDDAATLREYLGRFDPSFEGATGPLPRIVRLGRTVGVPIEKGQKLPSGGYDVNHGTQIVGLVPGHEAPYVWTEGTDPSDLADDISTILDGKVRSE
ncbi:MAG: SCO family protein [Nocardioidaceae bacterium]|nr:SCO family protein [Nocardioidaceae bacterium]NUS51467.1 SCO family protein [Nocardioidaceae bacterium]